ncbi:MAG: tetratricopeptide repeat protein [Candidatus Cloacimonetes bacterium]|nr:tetratricopeptide repeat protein [Candidatus Cloacimonadota bacterium]
MKGLLVRKTLFLLVIICVSISLFAKNQEAYKSVEQLIQLAESMQNEDLAKTVEICSQALEILEDYPDEALERKTHLLLAQTKRLMGLYEESLQSLEFLIGGNLNPEDRESSAHAYLTAASNLERMGEYVQAYEASIKALENFERLQDYKNVIATKILIGDLFIVLKNYNNAVQYLEEALVLARDNGFSKEYYNSIIRLGRSYQRMGEWEKSRTCMNEVLDEDDSSLYQKGYAHYIIGQTYLDEKNWDLALQNELKALEFAVHEDNLYLQSVAYTDLGYIEMNLGHYENALVYNQNALALRRERENQSLIASSLRNIGTLNIRFGKYDQAIEYLMKALDITRTNIEPAISSDIYLNLSKAYAALGEYKKSYDNLLEYANLKDKIYDETLISNIQDVEFEYFIEKKNAELEILRKDSEIKELEIKRQTILHTSIIIILVFLVIIIFLLLNKYRVSEKMSEKLEAMVETRTEELKNEILVRKETEGQLNRSLKEKELLLREIHHRVKNNLQVISGLLHLQQEEIKTKEDAHKGFVASQDRIQAMAKAYELLLGSPYMSEVSVGKYIEELANQIRYNYDLKGRVTMHYTMDEVTAGIEILDRLGLILNELLTNAIKYAFEGRDTGDIHIRLHKRENALEVTISDNGIGISEDYDEIHPKTLGLSIVQMLVQQLEGSMTVHLQNGTSFMLIIPL